LRPRNLRRRVELLVPVHGAEHRVRLDEILSQYLGDATAWDLQSDGSFTQRDKRTPGAQQYFANSFRP
jgi:polyphosphate kinase